jgi:hypothetical protein
MVQPREKTFHELLRQTQKIPRPEVHDFLFFSLSQRILFLLPSLWIAAHDELGMDFFPD